PPPPPAGRASARLVQSSPAVVDRDAELGAAGRLEEVLAQPQRHVDQRVRVVVRYDDSVALAVLRLEAARGMLRDRGAQGVPDGLPGVGGVHVAGGPPYCFPLHPERALLAPA